MTLGSEIIRVNATASTAEWNEVYRACAGAMPTQSSTWASAVVASGSYRNVSRFHEFADGCRAVMPLSAGQPALMTKIRPNPLDASIWREAAPAGWILLPGMAQVSDLVAQTYANYLLQSLAIKAACEAGCSHYHMGESGNSKPIAEFKSHFGGIPMPYAEFLFERLPISRADQFARSLLKHAIGFRDA